MKKYLDILLISLLFLFAFQYFSQKKIEETKKTESGIYLSLDKKEYSVPASIFLNIQNSSGTGITLDTCKDLQVFYNGASKELPEAFCSEVSLLNTELAKLDYSKIYKEFSEPGTYLFQLQYNDKTYITQAEIAYRGTLGKVFTGLFYAPVYNLLVFLINLFQHSLGWAIIAITVILRIILLYPQHKMMVSQRKLQQIQPKIKELQKQYKNDAQKMGIELMALYKKEKVNPLGSCGFLIIQMPILLVIYNIILNIKSPSNEFYLYDFLKDFHIESISFDFFGIHLLTAGGIVGIIFGITIALIQFIQIKLSLAHQQKTKQDSGLVLEKKKGEEDYNSMMPDPEMMNKFMLWGLPAMVGVFTYSLFTAIWLYWGISTLFAIFQQLVVNKITKK